MKATKTRYVFSTAPSLLMTNHVSLISLRLHGTLLSLIPKKFEATNKTHHISNDVTLIDALSLVKTIQKKLRRTKASKKKGFYEKYRLRKIPFYEKNLIILTLSSKIGHACSGAKINSRTTRDWGYCREKSSRVKYPLFRYACRTSLKNSNAIEYSPNQNFGWN